jgi:hypothetical protein
MGRRSGSEDQAKLGGWRGTLIRRIGFVHGAVEP